jgi:hypothetical protein
MQGSVRVISKISQDCEVNQGTYGTCGPLRAAKWNKKFYLRSALGPNQILFSYDQDPLRKSSTYQARAATWPLSLALIKREASGRGEPTGGDGASP